MSRTRRTPGRRPAPAPGAPRQTPGAPSRGRPLALAALAAVLVVAAGLAWWKLWPQATRAPRGAALPVAGVSAQAMLDSVSVHFRAHQWDRALAWAHESNLAAPGTATLLLNEGLAWHNYAQDGTASGRSFSRTSLDRMELEKRSFALLDSALAVARTDQEWANIKRWQGAQYEVLGLPLDAMRSYEEALGRAPDFQPAKLRLAWMQRVMVNPADPKSVTAKDAAPRP